MRGLVTVPPERVSVIAGPVLSSVALVDCRCGAGRAEGSQSAGDMGRRH
jgi:hypothetical protein